MQLTGLTVFTVCFAFVVLSVLVRIYEQVKRNQRYIEFLLEQCKRNIAERKRAERIKEWESHASSNQTG